MRRLALNFTVLGAGLLASGAIVWSAASLAAPAIRDRHPEAPTKLYLGNRNVSQLEQEGWGAYSLAGIDSTEIVRNGDHIFGLDTSTIPVFAFGYAPITSGRTWYVTLNKTKFVTIGAVSLRGPGVWDAYCAWTGTRAGMGMRPARTQESARSPCCSTLAAAARSRG